MRFTDLGLGEVYVLLLVERVTLLRNSLLLRVRADGRVEGAAELVAKNRAGVASRLGMDSILSYLA